MAVGLHQGSGLSFFLFAMVMKGAKIRACADRMYQDVGSTGSRINLYLLLQVSFITQSECFF